jgi:NAD(P)-dependent dehydrogenase (short-subunit alcohol dehydrogenase family)
MPTSHFDLSNKTAVVTGGGGILGRAMALGLARAGARLAILGRRLEPCQQVAQAIVDEGGQALALSADVVNRAMLERAAEQIEAAFGPVDILVNGAGGNQSGGTTSPAQSFFQLDAAALDQVFSQNFMGTFIASQVFGQSMAERQQGVIVNISSLSGLKPLTRIAAYSAAKAAVGNFTQWLAIHMAQEYSPRIRVNALAPGFFLTEQNRFLLTDETTGVWTERGLKIISHTPMGRMGAPDDLVGTLLWLTSSASDFVTGVVVPVDGGYSAFSGV